MIPKPRRSGSLFRRRDLSLDNIVAPGYFAEPSEAETPDSTRQAFFAYIDSARYLAGTVLALEPGKVGARYFLGASHGVLAAFAITIDHDTIEALEHGKTAYNIHKKIVETYPQCADAYLTVGPYEYIVDNLPWSIKWLALISGYRGSEERRFTYLERSARNGRLAARDAKLILMLLHLREERYPESLAIARELHRRHPRNVLLHVAQAQILERMGDAGQGVCVMGEVLQRIEAGRPNYLWLRSPIYGRTTRIGCSRWASAQDPRSQGRERSIRDHDENDDDEPDVIGGITGR